MKSYLVKDLMVPLEEYATVSHNATIYEAVLALEKAQDALERVAGGLASGLSNDLITVDLLESLDHLGDIVGETTTEDMLDVIFEQFCLGK